MKKLKVSGTEFSNTVKPVEDYIVRLEALSGALIVRYFKLLDIWEYQEDEVVSEVPVFSPDATPLFRHLVRDQVIVSSAALTSKEVKSPAAMEVGRHVFRPNIGTATVAGAGESYDFPIFVFPFGVDGNVSEPYNHIAESRAVKGQVGRSSRLRNAQPVFMAHAAKANAALDDWTLVYLESTPFLVEDSTPGVWEQAPEGFKAMDLLPSIELTGPDTVTPDGYVSINAQVVKDGAPLDYTGELVVEALAGYTPKTRVLAASGAATFKVAALGLDSGDTIRVKVGFKAVSGVADITLSVA